MFLGLLALLGFSIGTLGTMVGIGGGFLLVPALLVLIPEESSSHITAISIAMVFANALSGSIAYAKMKRIAYKPGLLFALAAIPGSILGVAISKEWSRKTFDPMFGGFLCLAAIFLLYKNRLSSTGPSLGEQPSGDGATSDTPRALVLGTILSGFVGVLSSILGIGGGLIHVPALIYWLKFPVHVATATSHFVLACTMFFTMMEHIRLGSYEAREGVTLAICAGAMLGAQLGAKLSKHISSRTLLMTLSGFLLLVGGRLVLFSL